MKKFYPHRGLRFKALEGGFEYNNVDDLKKIVTEIFYPGTVRMIPLEIVDKDYTHMVTLNYNAIGYVAEGENERSI